MPEQFDQCILCHTTKIRELKGYESNYLVRCSACEFVFCKRKPGLTELTEHYNKYPRDQAISPITIRRYNKLLDNFEKFRSTNNILDVGCGDGFFLTEAKKRGWNVFGVEFTDEAILVCQQKGIQMTKGPLNPGRYEKNFFDVITSFEVIEHINTPQNEADAIQLLLRANGLAYITTPNFNSISRFVLGSEWNVIEYPEHLSYYTGKTLRKLFEQKGFKLISLKTTGLSMDRLRNRTGNGVETLSITDESLRQKIDGNAFLGLIKDITNTVLSAMRRGDSIKAMFLKI